MSIPELIEGGKLPDGVHRTNLAETLGRSGYGNLKRAYLGNLLAELYDTLWNAGGETIVLGGSFVTYKENPDDIDCAILLYDKEKTIPQRWDRDGPVHLDIKPCQSIDELRHWLAFYQLQRKNETFKGCLRLDLPKSSAKNTKLALRRLHSEPLTAEPRGTFGSTPNEAKIKFLEKVFYENLLKAKRENEDLVKKLARGCYKKLKGKYDIGDLLPKDIDSFWHEKNGNVNNIANINIEENEFLILEQIRLKLRELDEKTLELKYKKELRNSRLVKVVEPYFDDWLKDKT